jgi:uncharacterized RDD family membrane protein YckC
LIGVGIGLAIILTLALGGAGDVGAGVGALIGFSFPVPFVVYLAVFHGGARGQTPGKREVGIAVRDASTLDRIGYARAFGRSCLTMGIWVVPLGVAAQWFRPLEAFVFVGILDSVWPLWDSKRQALHDKAARTVVIRATPS